MEDKMQTYRQPLVTSTGIILGFILNFASSWVKTESSLKESLAYFVGISILVGTMCLIFVLYRALKISYEKENSEAYYISTFRIFIMGICFAFMGVFADMFANFMMD